jgi:hypothetical protein
MPFAIIPKTIEALNTAEPSNRAQTSIYDRLHNASEHIHKESKVYPTATNGVTVTASTTAWVLGAYAEIVPASGIGSDFDIHFVELEGVSDPGLYELVLYAATTEIGRIRFKVAGTPNNLTFQARPFMSPIISADTQIQAKLMTDTGNDPADTCEISIQYHTY